MSESKHTPGPWEWVEDRLNGGFSGLVGPDGAEVLFPNTRNEGDTGAAWFEDFPTPGDAHLLAAAPDLLEALRGAIGALEFSRDYHSDLGNEDQAFAQDRLDAATKAILKATGGEA